MINSAIINENKIQYYLVGEKLFRYRLSALTQIGCNSVDNNFVIESQQVSAVHARIIIRANQVFVEDLGSSNGTFVNWERIDDNTEVLLRHGDIVAFDQFYYVLEVNKYPSEFFATQKQDNIYNPSNSISTNLCIDEEVRVGGTYNSKLDVMIGFVLGVFLSAIIVFSYKFNLLEFIKSLM